MSDAAATSSVQQDARAPRVSVVSSFYNVEKYLAEMIGSVLAQDFEDFEILLVDDGSSDASTEIAKGFARRLPQRLRYLEHPGHANRGACAGRNLGISRARGELIAFVDGDDRWRPAKLREQVELLDRMPEVGALFGSANYWASWAGGSDEVVPSGHVRNRPVHSPEALLNVYPLGSGASPCPDILIRRSTLDLIGGFEEAFVGRHFLYEDQAFFLKLYLHATVYFSESVWLDYRLHDQSCTARGEREGIGGEERRFCLEWFEDYLARTRQRYDPRIRLALMRALRPYRHPRLSAAGRRVKSLLRQAPDKAEPA
jgi:glycosyltransferase involved in cell wall biosynthesis